MFENFSEYLQQREIADAREAAEFAQEKAGRNAERFHDEVRRLETKINQLALFSQALWELLREKTNLTEVDIEAKMTEIDSRDGRRDGKITDTRKSKQ